MSSAQNKDLTEEQIEIYDRQIRDWGPECQKILSNSTLHLQPLNSLNFEIAKNCILSGINLQLFDTSLITEADISSNLFFPESSFGTSRCELAQKVLSQINTLAKVEIGQSLESVCMACFSGSLSEAIEFNEKTRDLNIAAYFLFTAGNSVLVISDHKGLSLKETLDLIPGFILRPKSRPNARFYSFLAYLYSLYSKGDADLLQSIIPSDTFHKGISEIASSFNSIFYPSIQVISGLVSQDMIKYLTNREDCFSTLLFDSETSTAYADKIN